MYMSDVQSSNTGDEQLKEATKKVHRSFPTGVTIVTTSHESKPYGLAVNAFSSVSLDPPMVLVCINATSSTYPRFFASRCFGISILANDQVGVAARFAKSGGDKFAGLPWTPGPSGQPLIDGSAADLELEIISLLPAGSHTIIVGRVLTASATGKGSLVYHDGAFFDGSKLNALDFPG